MSPTPANTLDPQQIIADLQRANAELQRRLDEALDRETATAEVLGIINSSPSDLAPVFDAMLEKALRLCGAEFGMMNTFDGEHFHHAADRGVPAAYASYRRRRGPIIFGLGTAPTRLVEGENLVHGADLMATEPYQRGNPNSRALVDLGGARSHLCVALRKGDILLGDIVIYRQEVRPFTDKQIALLQNFAAQAVIAMENARLITETREALEQQTATAEVLGVINSSPGDLAPVFDAMLEKATRLCEAPFGILRTWDGERFHFGAVHGDPRFSDWVRQRGPFRPDRDESLLGRILAGERVVHFSDAAGDEGYRTDTGFRKMVEASGIRSAITVALHKDDALLGTITVYRQEVRPFTDKQIALLQNFAAQAVIAMENARLITETREALEQQTATAEVLAVINSSPGDLTPVFDAILEKAHTLCDASTGSLRVIDGDMIRAVAFRGQPGEFADRVQEGYPFASAPLLASLRDGAPFVHISDVAERDDSISRLSTASGNRTILAVPLRKDDALLGMIVAGRKEVRPFTHKEIALLQNFAAQAVIAMENARLLTETREALDQQTATAEVLGVINSSPGDLTPVFDAILENAHRLCGIALGELELYENGTVHAVAMRGVSGSFAELLRQPFVPPPGSPPARLLAGERIVQVIDVSELAQDLPDDPRAQTGAQDGLRTALFVPLRKDDALLGYITGYRRVVRPFTDKQIALLQNFAAQAVIAMENARLITETREALEQQTATAEVLQVINSSPGDLAPVFDAMLEKATRLCEADFGILWSFDGELATAGALHRVPAAYADMIRTPFRPSPESGPARMMRGDSTFVVPDLLEFPPYHAGDTLVKAIVDLAGARTVVIAPLRKDALTIGAITVYRQEVRPFTERQIDLLENFAAQAVIAMENARLITETREALEQQTATAEVLGVINSSPGDLAPVFDALLDKALRLCEASYGMLVTWDGEQLHRAAIRGLSVELMEALGPEITMPQPGSVPDRLLHGENIIYTADITQDPSLARAPRVQTWAQVGGARSYIAVPLRKDDRLLGFIGMYHREVRPFTDKQIALLQNFAAQAVIAMENARLITETREALEQQTATAEVLQVINSSPGELGPVFDAMLEKMLRLCEAAHGNFLTYDGEVFHRAAFRGAPQFAEYRRHQGPQRPAESGQLARMVQGGGTLHRIDAREGEAYRDDPAFRRAVDGLGIRTSLTVPLRKGDALLGAVRAYRLEVRPFTDKQIALVENFAAQAVIAIENARLLSELRQRTEEVGELNRDLEARVAEQVDELGRVGRLKRFLAPQLAELIVSQGDEKILESHRREIVVVFCDLRGYTAFTETAEPEEVLDFLREYHGALGPLVSQFEGTLDQFSGDGIMVFFNDPVPCADPAQRAVNMAIAMRSAANTLIADWRERGRDLGFGAGIAQGYATLGQIGFSERSGYTAIGTVCNVAARLCAEAKDGQILLGQRVNVALKGSVATEQLGPLTLKGLTQPVVAYNVPLGAIQPALRVIEGGSPETV